MKASDYKVSFPYGATSSPYSATRPHSGEDRAMPTGTPIDVGDTIIGLSGSTGISTGPHLHTQKYQGGFQHPQGKGLANTIPFPAKVSEVGERSDIGKYVRILDANGVRWSYFHQSKVNVAIGYIIKAGGSMASFSVDQIKVLAEKGSIPQTTAQLAEGATKPAYEVALNFLLTVRNRLNGVIAERDKEIVALKAQIAAGGDTAYTKIISAGQDLYVKE